MNIFAAKRQAWRKEYKAWQEQHKALKEQQKTLKKNHSQPGMKDGADARAKQAMERQAKKKEILKKIAANIAAEKRYKKKKLLFAKEEKIANLFIRKSDLSSIRAEAKKSYRLAIGKKIKKTLNDQELREYYNSEKTIKCRLSFLGKNFKANYNKNSIAIIEEYGLQHGYSFQHAENGGEYLIKELGYWVDGYDIQNNVVIEYYEKRHNKRESIIRDEVRKEQIVKLLGCKFIEIREKAISKKLAAYTIY